MYYFVYFIVITVINAYFIYDCFIFLPFYMGNGLGGGPNMEGQFLYVFVHYCFFQEKVCMRHAHRKATMNTCGHPATSIATGTRLLPGYVGRVRAARLCPIRQEKKTF